MCGATTHDRTSRSRPSQARASGSIWDAKRPRVPRLALAGGFTGSSLRGLLVALLADAVQQRGDVRAMLERGVQLEVDLRRRAQLDVAADLAADEARCGL